MNCPKCGGEFKVRKSARAGCTDSRKYLAEKAAPTVKWYVGLDYMVRQRKCVDCNYSQETVEVLLKDCREMIIEIANKGIPKDF